MRTTVTNSVCLVSVQSKYNKLFSYVDGLLIRNISTSPACKVGDVAGNIASNGYAVVSIDNKKTYQHRIIWTMLRGDIPDDLEIDHIDGCKFNNKIENLRLIDHHKNCQNNTHCGWKGYHYDKKRKKYRVNLKWNNTVYFIGRFDTIELARSAYTEAKRRMEDEDNSDEQCMSGVCAI